MVVEEVVVLIIKSCKVVGGEIETWRNVRQIRSPGLDSGPTHKCD